MTSMSSPFLENIPLRHPCPRSRRIRPGAANFKRIRQLRTRISLIRSQKWDMPTAFAVFSLFSELTDAIDICCDFIRVQRAPGQKIVNEVWKETKFMADLLQNLQKLEAEKTTILVPCCPSGR